MHCVGVALYEYNVPSLFDITLWPWQRLHSSSQWRYRFI